MKENIKKCSLNRDSLKRRSLIIGGIVFLIVAGIITFTVASNNTLPLQFDFTVQNMLMSLRGDIQNLIIIGITHLSDTVFIVGFCIILILLPNRKRYGIPVTTGALSGLAIYKPMKSIFMRSRPDISLHLVEQGGFSFPSGHSVTSVIVYGLLAYLIYKNVKDKKKRNILMSICIFLAIAIGPSRIYVGVHWPTDVLCGMAIGAFVLLIEIYILNIVWRSKHENL